MNKIIGFLITKENNQPKVDFFDMGIKIITIQHNSYNIYLWGIGDIENYKIDDKYSLSFPLHDNLLDRNIFISFENEKIIIENDWLGSIPVFYNQKEKIVSTISNFCIKDKTMDRESLSNFCEFGYSVFEQTIFQDIKFMRYFSKLIVSDIIELVYKDDLILDSSFTEKEYGEVEVVELMQDYISDRESTIDGEIILPTSGGYDSRILNYLIKDKSRIRSFTYGISRDQDKSTEVVHAQKISEIYNTKWEQIELKKYHKDIDKWFEIYGLSTHLHGMYHIEFYREILERHDLSNKSFLSGIIGDAWAELDKFETIEKYQDLIKLGYTHGMELELKYLNFKSNNTLKKEYFMKNEKSLQNDKLKSIFAMRTKIILISYLTQIPEYFGMPVWTPFLNFDIVKATLNISDKRRKDRVWQKDFFKKVGLNLEDMHLQSIKSNRLDYDIAKKFDFEKIDINLMKPYIEEKRLEEINSILTKISLFEEIKNNFLYIKKIGKALKIIGVKNNYLKALYEYYIIKSIEKGLKYAS